MRINTLPFLAIMLTAPSTALYGQVPALGATATFALFTPAGALGDTGSLTNILGDIGTNTGAITGYSAGNVTGDIHSPDALTAQATNDVQTAYNQLVALPCPAGPGLAPAMGNGQMLTPATYCFGGAASVAGDLILDGQNDSNALFIFKINGAFTAAATARVLLINGASASNVWWQAGGDASFAAMSSLAGIIVANGAIAFGDGASLQGKGLSTGGAISTYNNRITQAAATPLPVELTAFTAKAQGLAAVGLAWRTASETHSARFEAERSTDGRIFDYVVGTVAAAGSTSGAHTYTLTDTALPPAGTPLYYRLRQVDYDGSFTYSPVRVVARPPASNTRLYAYPSPAHDVVRVRLPSAAFPLQLLDASGRIVRAQALPGTDAVLPVAGVPAGLYLLRCGLLSQRLTLE